MPPIQYTTLLLERKECDLHACKKMHDDDHTICMHLCSLILNLYRNLPCYFSGLRYADGVLPGQGSPDYDDSPNQPAAVGPKPKANQGSGAGGGAKKRKRIKIKVIEIKTKAEVEADKNRVPPPPPPGDPPLMHTQEFINNYAYKGTLPKHIMALVSA